MGFGIRGKGEGTKESEGTEGTEETEETEGGAMKCLISNF
jgi:hypothetical protein